MDDLISRQGAIEAIEKEAYRHTYIEQIIDIINNLPSVQPEEDTIEMQEADIDETMKRLRDARVTILPSAEPRMKGKWIYGENDCQDGWFCSECRFFIPWDYDYYGLNNIDFIKDFHVCPHCKAEMVTYTGKKEDTDG